MTRDARHTRQESVVAAAVLGAHASGAESFRQRDVKFLIDLFSNWSESALRSATDSFQNTQVQRYLDQLAVEGYARKLSKGAHPRYRLTRVGLLELLSRLSNKDRRAQEGSFFFIYFFLKNYGPRLATLVKEEGSEFPYALQVELEALLNVAALVRNERERVATEIKRVAHRIEYAQGASALCNKLLKEGKALPDVVREAQNKFPYDLNSQKPLTELIASVPEQFRAWELQEGNLRRVSDLWQHELGLLKAYFEELKKL